MPFLQLFKGRALCLRSVRAVMMFGEKRPDFSRYEEAMGTYVCARCGQPLFAADKQFDAGCGFPSFWLHLQGGVQQKKLDTYGRNRVQLLCSRCGLHLGHLFPNRHTPTRHRYCINAEAIRLQEEQQKQPDLPINNTTLMALNNAHFEETKDFIRQHRSNETNFETLVQKLDAEIAATQQNGGTGTYAESLQELKEKKAAEYRIAKEESGSAWPEFEKFVSEWEKAITASMKEES